MQMIKYASLTAALGAMIALLSLSAGTGCGSCHAETTCLGKEGLLVQDKIYSICGVDATHEGDRYTWQTDSGDCSCTLELSDSGSYNWRGCDFTAQ
jgi:hypothetical protein